MNIHKTRLSLLLNTAVSVLGALSLTAAVVRESERWLRVFRYMTVIGTLYTTLLSCAVFVLGLRALRTGREAGGAPLYFLRLSAAVTESVIAIVIALSFLPSIPDDPDIFRFDSFIMHVLLPPLSVTAFVLGAPPQAKQRPLTHFNGSWLLTVYSAAVTAMIITGVMPPGEIPYSFLEAGSRPLWYVLLAAAIVYGGAYLLSVGLCAANRGAARLFGQGS